MKDWPHETTPFKDHPNERHLLQDYPQKSAKPQKTTLMKGWPCETTPFLKTTLMRDNSYKIILKRVLNLKRPPWWQTDLVRSRRGPPPHPPWKTTLMRDSSYETILKRPPYPQKTTLMKDWPCETMKSPPHTHPHPFERPPEWKTLTLMRLPSQSLAWLPLWEITIRRGNIILVTPPPRGASLVESYLRDHPRENSSIQNYPKDHTH